MRQSQRFWIILLLLFWRAGVAWCAAPAATVQAAAGRLVVRRQGSSQTLTVRSTLYVGDVVATGPNGKATLLFSDGSQVRLNSNTTIEITARTNTGQGRQSLFRALAGEVWSRLRPGNAAQTRSTTAGVRGTVFLLKVETDDTTTLTVIEGTVDFSNAFGAVVVGVSQQSVARPGAPPTAPVTINNAGLLLEWTLDLDRAILPREKFFVSLDRQVLSGEMVRRAARVRRQPDDAQARRDYGDALFDSRRFDPALVEYEAAQRLTPNQTATSLRLGYALLELGRLDEAELAFRAALASTAPDDGQSDGQLGLAALALARDRPAAAQAAAEQVIAMRANDAPAHIALGLALMRQTGRLDEAATAFESALRGEPASYHYQAQAWLALVRLAQGATDDALRQATAAVAQAPDSGLARGNLALVLFFTGQVREAQREAARAVALNPDSMAAQVALGQALLARGDVDAAERTAARAVALDPELPQAHYLLGVADAGRRDYSHATRELQRSLNLAPDFVPAREALARVYNAVSRQGEALALLSDLPARLQSDPAVLAARGAVLYEQGHYGEAAAQYQEAVRRRPGSALYQAELARLLIYTNRLSAAIEAAQSAVQLAPRVGQYHAWLGLAYAFSSQAGQAEREFRIALTLDPQNALALGQLALQGRGADLRGAEAARSTQSFLLDPAISTQLLRGGINTEITPVLGDNKTQNLNGDYRLTTAGGKLHALGLFGRNADAAGNNSANADQTSLDAEQYVTYTSGARTNFFLNLRGLHTRRGLPGMDFGPDAANGTDGTVQEDDRSSFHFGQAQFALRRRLGTGRHLWIGLFGNDSNNQTTDPSLNSFFDELSGLTVARERFTSRALEPEMRFDATLNRTPGHLGILTLGAAHARTTFDNRRNLALPGTMGTNVSARGTERFLERDNTTLAYAQWSQQMSDHFSWNTQLRWQSVQQRRSSSAILGGTPLPQSTESQSKSRLLPSFLATYGAGRHTTLRLSLNRRVTDITTSTFAPTETLLTTEAAVLPFGTPNVLSLAQLDIEHYLPSHGFVRLFFWHSRANGVSIGGSDPLGFGGGLPAVTAPSLFLSNWESSGAGARLEHRLGPHLFADLGLAVRHTVARTSGEPFEHFFSNQEAPYEPKFVGSLELNYIDHGGNKVGVRLRHNGAFFEDSPLALGRPRFPAATYFDLLLAREPSVHLETFLSITNIFNRRQVLFNGFSTGGRRVEVGVTRRF